MTDFQITYKCIVEQKVKVPEEQHNIFMIVMVSYLPIGYENKYHDRKIGHIVVTLYNQKETQKDIRLSE